MADTDDGTKGNDMGDVRAAVKQLQAEMEWVKVVLSGQKPAEAPQKTSPPWITIVTFVVGPAMAAFIATAPWK